MKPKARTKGAKKRGRPRIEGVMRTPSGQISRSAESKDVMTSLELEAATWKRRQDNPKLTPSEARKQEHGSVIAMWRLEHEVTVKRYGNGPHPNEFTRIHHDTAQHYHELYHRWLGAIEARRARSSSDFSGPGGYDGRNPFDDDMAKRHARIEAEFKEARRAVLESGPLGMMAIETIVIENQNARSMMGDLRAALNRLAVLWRMQKAA